MASEFSSNDEPTYSDDDLDEQNPCISKIYSATKIKSKTER